MGREQEFGNLQGEEFSDYRREQQSIGRFFYRFPTGESGADVFDRTRSWWNDTLLTHNVSRLMEPVDTVLIFTHGLTMRLILMQLDGWSVDTFHAVWNAGNRDIYVLQKDMNSKQQSPYKLDSAWDMPKSSTTVTVELASGDRTNLKLSDYLSLRQPRTLQFDAAARMIEAQHNLPVHSVKVVDFFGGKYSKFK